MKNPNKYPQGFLPKIEYYQYQITQAIERLDVQSMHFHASKLEYFMKRQSKLEREVMGLS